MATAADTPQPGSGDPEPPQLPDRGRRWRRGLRRFGGPDDSSPVSERDDAAGPLPHRGVIGGAGDDDAAGDRQRLGDLATLPDLHLERVVDLSAHRSTRSS